MENPFIYGKEVSGSSFADREKEMKELLADLKRGQNVMIYSPRRYGKTSLIKKVLGVLKRAKLITVYVDLYKATSQTKFVDIYARAVAEQVTGNLGKVMALVKNFLPKLLPKVVIRAEGAPEIEFDYNHQRPITPLLDDLLESVAKIARQRGRNAVVVFDEFQEITDYGDDEIERAMRTRFQAHNNVAYVFMGSKQHLMKKLFLSKNRPFYHSGKHFQLMKIPAEKFADFIAGNFRKGGFKIPTQVVADILNKTECHPYYTQLLGSALWDYAQERGRSDLTARDVDQALNLVLDRESHAYVEIWDSLKGYGRILVEALAKCDQAKIFSSEFAVANNLAAPASIQRPAYSLEERGIIERRNGHYALADVFFKMWVLRNIV